VVTGGSEAAGGPGRHGGSSDRLSRLQERCQLSQSLSNLCTAGRLGDSGGFSSGVMRPLVTAIYHCQIFDAVHSLAHPGIRASRRMISSCYVWPNLATDVTAGCRDCTDCQRAKVTKQPAATVQPIPVPSVRFHTYTWTSLGLYRCPKKATLIY
jgi:Integrase zinc binding domain